MQVSGAHRPQIFKGQRAFKEILLVSFAIAFTAIDKSEATYGCINQYLIKHVDTDNVAPNMEAASEWLNERAGSFLSAVLINHLKKFTALQQVVGDTKCDQTSYEIMGENAYEVDLFKLIETDQIGRRVDTVILKILRDHARGCLEVYREKNRTREGQLDETVFGSVEKLSKWIIDVNNFSRTSSPSKILDKYIKNHETIRSFGDIDTMYNLLKYSASKDAEAKCMRKVADEHTGKRAINKAKLNSLVQRYLLSLVNSTRL